MTHFCKWNNKKMIVCSVAKKEMHYLTSPMVQSPSYYSFWKWFIICMTHCKCSDYTTQCYYSVPYYDGNFQTKDILNSPVCKITAQKLTMQIFVDTNSDKLICMGYVLIFQNNWHFNSKSIHKAVYWRKRSTGEYHWPYTTWVQIPVNDLTSYSKNKAYP